MKTENVYYGFTKEGKYCLLLKRYKTVYTDYGDISKSFYYDLEEKCEYDMSEIDLDTLNSIKNIVGSQNKMSRRKVKKMYKIDSDRLIDTQGAYYGNIVYKKYINGIYPILETIKENILFARIDDPEGRSMNLNTNLLYTREERMKNGTCVKEIRPINTEDFENVVEPKRKILELDYQKRL